MHKVLVFRRIPRVDYKCICECELNSLDDLVDLTSSNGLHDFDFDNFWICNEYDFSTFKHIIKAEVILHTLWIYLLSKNSTIRLWLSFSLWKKGLILFEYNILCSPMHDNWMHAWNNKSNWLLIELPYRIAYWLILEQKHWEHTHQFMRWN